MKNNPDFLFSERFQILVRIGLGLIGFLIILLGISWEGNAIAWLLPFMALHLLFNIGTYWHLDKSPDNNLRRYLAILSDTAIVTLAAWSTGGLMSGVSTVYFIILLGNAVRYGQRFLLFATLSVLMGEVTLMLLSIKAPQNYWSYEVFKLAAYAVVTLYIWSVLQALGQRNRELETAWRKTETLISKLPALVCYFGSDGKVRFASEQAQSVLGVSAQALEKGEIRWDGLLTPESSTQFSLFERRGTLRYRITRPDNGAIRWIEDRRDTFVDEEGELGVVSVAQDVTAELENHARLLNLSKLKVVHTQVLQSLLQDKDLEVTLEECARLIGQTFNAECVIIPWRHDEADQAMELHVWHAGQPDPNNRYAPNPRLQVWHKVLALEHIKIWDNLEPTHPLWGRVCGRYGVDRVLALSLPIGEAGRCGLVLLGNSQRPAWPAEDHGMLRTLLSSISHGIERSLLRQQANTDSLTGVMNRRAMEKALADNIERAKNQALPMSVALCDIDYFKVINDSFGHDVGDEVLRIFSERLRHNVRRSDRVSRIGGEEFLVLLPGQGLQEALESAERLRARTEETAIHVDGGEKIYFTTSIGVAEWRSGEDMQDLLQRADQALYTAKKGGRNRVQAANL